MPAAFSRFVANGYYVQGSYFIIPRKLQASVKWESFNPGKVNHDDVRSITAGLNYYIHGDSIKLMAAMAAPSHLASSSAATCHRFSKARICPRTPNQPPA